MLSQYHNNRNYVLNTSNNKHEGIPFTHAIDVLGDGLCLWRSIAMQQTQNESPYNLIQDFVNEL